MVETVLSLTHLIPPLRYMTKPHVWLGGMMFLLTMFFPWDDVPSNDDFLRNGVPSNFDLLG